MIEIIKGGLIETDEHLLNLMRESSQIVVPEDDELELTHWWLLPEDGIETTYVGTIATFDMFVRERNGGLQ